MRTLAIVTGRDPDGLEIIRHSTAHLLAQAVQAVYPDAQVTIGPVIEDGFYYDFAFSRPFTPDDLVKFEQKMHELVLADLGVERRVMPRDEAVATFERIGEHYKAEIIASIPANEDISLYGQGGWFDLCRGPHVPSTGKLGAFKLMKVAGAYWRGDSKNEMLQRIYGTAWPDDKQLKAYLTRLEEAEKRDHRRVGRELDLFHTQEEAVGSVFWHPKGWTLWRIDRAVHARAAGAGRLRRGTDAPAGRPLAVGALRALGELRRRTCSSPSPRIASLAVKPMNCPGHVMIYRQGIKSYRDLPLRMAEFGACHRNEPSGALHGIMRVRAFTQDDAHIFCTEEQINAETCRVLLAAEERVRGLRLHRRSRSSFPTGRPSGQAPTRCGTRPRRPCKGACEAAGLEYTLNPGEGAFYGPKLEFVLRDAIGRDWQCGTLQLDPILPERLGAEYIGEDGAAHRPVMLHRAVLGSMERFIGILIEHHAGRFPAWLAPVQAVVMNITDGQADYCRQAADFLKNQGLRVETDLRNEKVGFKIREHTLQRVPYLLVAGDREAGSNTLAVRTRSGKDLGAMPLEAIASKLAEEVASRGRVTLEV